MVAMARATAAPMVVEETREGERRICNQAKWERLTFSTVVVEEARPRRPMDWEPAWIDARQMWRRAAGSSSGDD